MMKPLMMNSALLVALTMTGPALHAQDRETPATDAGPELVVRFYDVSQLIVAKPQYPFTGKIPASSAGTTPFSGGLGGAAMGGGGLGGGGLGGVSGGMGGGGGGFFSVPPVAVQFGGGMQGGGFGGGGLGGGGFSLGAANPAAEAESYFMADYSTDGIAELLIFNIDPPSWEDQDGPGTVTALGNTLLIRQTVANHKAIGQFLKDLTAAVVGVDVYEMEAWWIPAAPAERRELSDVLRNAADQAEWNSALNTLAEQTGGFHGRLLCRERTTTHQASGVRRPLVVGSVPVVGGSSSMAQPVVNHVNIGLTMEATVIPVADYLAEAGEDEDMVYLNLRSAITSDAEPTHPAASAGEIDRFEIGANVLESGVRIPVGRPVLVGTLTSVGIRPLEGQDENETSLVVAVTRKN